MIGEDDMLPNCFLLSFGSLSLLDKNIVRWLSLVFYPLYKRKSIVVYFSLLPLTYLPG